MIKLNPAEYTIRVLVGCGSQKLDSETAARDMYTSTYFKKKRGFAELYGDDWVIISAEHHVLDPDTVISPYDASVNNMKQRERDNWGNETTDQLQAEDWSEIDVLIVLLGQSYIDPIRNVLTALPVTTLYPFDHTSGNGDQIEWLTEHNTEARHDTYDSHPVITIPECDETTESTDATDQTMLSTF